MDNTLIDNKFSSLTDEISILFKNQSWFNLYGVSYFFMLLRFILLGFGFWIFIQSGFWYRFVGLILIGYSNLSIAMVGTHETSHNVFTPWSRVNRILLYFFSDIWSQSSEWWIYRHIKLHHAHNNHGNQEFNLNKNIHPILSLFILPILFSGIWLTFGSIRFLWGNWKQLIIYLSLWTVGVVVHVYFFMFAFNFWIAFGLAYLSRSLFTPLFMHIALFNHNGLDEPIKKVPWLKYQTLTTRNLKKNWLINFFGGSDFVQYHIEHHLYPNLPSSLFKKIQPLIQSYTNKEGLNYSTQSYSKLLSYSVRKYFQR